MANEQINKIKKEYFVMDEYGYTDKELIDKVNELIDKVNELNALFNTSQKVRDKMVKQEDVDYCEVR